MAKKTIKKDSKDNFFKTHARRIGLGILVMIQAIAVGIIAGVIFLWVKNYGLWLAGTVLLIILIYLAGMYEENQARKLAAKSK